MELAIDDRHERIQGVAVAAGPTRQELCDGSGTGAHSRRVMKIISGTWASSSGKRSDASYQLSNTPSTGAVNLPPKTEYLGCLRNTARPYRNSEATRRSGSATN